MRHNRWVSLMRMSLGSVIGIVGFATLSMGFVELSPPHMLEGLGEILLGTFVALGVLAPLRKAPGHAPSSR